MNQYYQDNMLFGMNPSSYLHRYAVNGKVSGNLACISEIKNAAVVLYSPRGCGFHYRCHVRSGQSPVYELECADLRNNDVIFGGRLGEYKYYDMDAVIASALEMSEKELA